MDFKTILADLKNKKYAPVYFLEGEEPYFIDRISDYIQANVLTEAEKGFNQTILYGKETDIDTIITASRRFPMMAERQVVIVKEAQNIRNIDELSHYVEKPNATTVLVICFKYKKIDKRKKLYKSVGQAGVYFESKSLYENKIPAWIHAYLKAQNFGIEARAAQMIADYLGTDLKRIVSELDKLTISLPPGMSITPDEVEQNIGISKDFNTFELQDALGKRDVLKANRIVAYFADNEKMHPLPVTLGILLSFFRKILTYHSLSDKTNNNNVGRAMGVNPFFVKDYVQAARIFSREKAVYAITALRETDLRSKGARGGSVSNGELLRELIFKLLHI